MHRFAQGARRLTRALPAPLPPRARLPWWSIPILVAGLTLLQMVRRPASPPPWDSLFAEDAQIFLSQALSQHFLDTLATSYFGYLHTAPRLITNAATWFPLDDAPLVMSLLTAFVIAFLCVYVFEASGAWIASPLLRAVLALAVAFLPVTAKELAGTVANLHWYLVYASFWALICPWRSRGWLLASGAVVALGVLSDPLVVVFLPIAAALAIRDADRRAWILPGIVVAGLVTQLALRDEGTTFFGQSRHVALPRVFAERVTSSLLVGDRYFRQVFGHEIGSPFAWSSLALVVIAAAAALWLLRGRRRWLVAGGALLSVGFFTIAMLTRGSRSLVPNAPWVLGSTRYIYLPVMFLLTAMLAAVDRRAPGGRRLPVRELLVAGLAVATMATGYAAPHRSSEHPTRWKPAVAQARLACAGARAVGVITVYGRGPGLTAVVPVTPPHWSVPIPCSRLH